MHDDGPDTAPIDNETLRQLDALILQGTPENTRRALRRDHAYITAWKHHRFGDDLAWPEEERVALLFVLDHAEDLTRATPGDPATTAARETAVKLVSAGLRRSLQRPAPSTLDRRIASWMTLHAMRNLPSPFESPMIRRARKAARAAAGHRERSKAARPVTRDLLIEILDACPNTLAGMRDRALLEVGWSSGGRRRSELAKLEMRDLDLTGYRRTGVVRLSMLTTKTTKAGETPRLMVKGPSADALVAWIEAAGLQTGPVFRAISKADRALERGLSESGVREVFKKALVRAGFRADDTSPHGLRSGFLTQASLDGIPMLSAMRLSLHKTVAQAAKYYADADLSENPAVNIRTPRET